MKKFIKRNLCLIIAILSIFSAKAYTFEVDNIYYTVIDQYVSVTNGENKYEGNITIPEVVRYDNNQYTVTLIDDNAFSDCANLESVKLPDTIKKIGYSSFLNCNKLKSINLPESLEIIDDISFWNCYELQIDKYPDNLKKIEYRLLQAVRVSKT